MHECLSFSGNKASWLFRLSQEWGKPHRPVTAPSIGSCLRDYCRSLVSTLICSKQILHVHGALTTSANSNIPISEILKMADWSTPSTFQRFYYKPLHISMCAFSVLYKACLPTCPHLKLSCALANIGLKFGC